MVHAKQAPNAMLNVKGRYCMKLYASLCLASVCLVNFVHGQGLSLKINEVDEKIRWALKSRSFEALGTIYGRWVTPEFQSIEPDKHQSLAEMLMDLRQGLSKLDRMTMVKVKPFTLRRVFADAIGTTLYVLGGRVVDPETQIEHKWYYTGTATEYYVQRDGEWKLAKMIWTDQRELIDGQQVP